MDVRGIKMSTRYCKKKKKEIRHDSYSSQLGQIAYLGSNQTFISQINFSNKIAQF